MQSDPSWRSQPEIPHVGPYDIRIYLKYIVKFYFSLFYMTNVLIVSLQSYITYRIAWSFTRLGEGSSHLRLFYGAFKMNLIFKRKLTKSAENKAAQITIPRCIAEIWSDFSSIDLIFDGRCLVVVPSQ